MGPGLNKHTSIWSRLYPGFVLLTLSAAMAFSLIDRFALSLLFEPIKADLQLSDTQLGLLHGVAFGLFYATLGIPIAWLVDRWSRKWVIFLGIGCWSAMTALCGFSRNFSQLLGARIGVGVGEAALAPGGYSLIADVVPKNKFATAISIFQMGSLFGAGLALLLGGQILGFVETIDLSGMPLLGSLAPWQLTFIVLALPGIPFLLVLLLFREPLRTGVVSDEPAVGLLEELRKKYQVYTCLFLGNACLVAVSYGNVTWIPSILARQYGWSIPDIGVRLGLLTLIVAPLGILAGGLLADARTRRGSTSPSSGLLMLSGVTTLILVVVGLFAQSAWAFIRDGRAHPIQYRFGSWRWSCGIGQSGFRRGAGSYFSRLRLRYQPDWAWAWTHLSGLPERYRLCRRNFKIVASVLADDEHLCGAATRLPLANWSKNRATPVLNTRQLSQSRPVQ